MKKYILLSLAAAILLQSAACGNDVGDSNKDNVSDTPTKTDIEETTLSESDMYPLPDVDMDGFELSFLNYDNTYMTWAINELDVEAETADIINDEIYRRNRRVESKYNAQINVTCTSRPDQELRSLMLSGDTSYDIVMVYDEHVINFFVDGLIASWDILPYCDMDRSWWNQDASKVFNIERNQFAAVGDFSLALISRPFALMFNKKLYDELGAEYNMYELVKENKWTLDKLAEIGKLAVKDLNGDTVMDDKDQYAVSNSVKGYYGSLVTGAGIKYIDVDSDGIPHFALDGNSRAFDVFEKILNIHSTDNLFYKCASSIHDGFYESSPMFRNEQLLFYISSLKRIPEYRDVDFDFGILPIPKFDENQENYYHLTSGAPITVIPITLPDERCNNVSILLDALCRDSHDNLIPTYMESVLKTKFTRDEESSDMLNIIINSMTFDLGLSVMPSLTYYPYMENYQNMTNNFASTTAKAASDVKAKLETIMNTYNENK